MSTTHAIDPFTVAPEAVRPLLQAAEVVRTSDLDEKLVLLVELRASQINGCAFCLTLHSLEAEALGEEKKRLFSIAGWRDARWFSDRERLALEWTEHLTLIAEQRPSDDLVARMKGHFNDANSCF